MFFFFQPVIPKALLEFPPVLSNGFVPSLPWEILLQEYPGSSLINENQIFFLSELKQNFSKGFLFFPFLG